MLPDTVLRLSQTTLHDPTAETLTKLRHHLTTNGLLLIEDALTEPTFNFFAAGYKALHLPAATKQAYGRQDVSTGYTPPGIEGVRGHASDWQRHFWDILSPDRNQNRFPDTELPEFRLLAERIFRTVEDVAVQTLRVVGLACDKQARHVADDAANGQHMLRLSHYFSNHESDTVLFPAHVDFGLLTFYLPGSVRGLQILIDGIWHEVFIPPTAILAAVGTTLRIYDPNVVPVRHRVMGYGYQRLSAVFFTEPRAEVVLPNGENAGTHLLNLVQQIRKNERYKPESLSGFFITILTNTPLIASFNHRSDLLPIA